VLPLLINEIGGLLSMYNDWRQIRVMANTLPYSMSQIDSASLQIPAEYALHNLEGEGTFAALRACMPNVQESALKNLVTGRDGRPYRDFVSTIRLRDARHLITTRREFVACIPTTVPGYPVPALNSFLGTVSVNGMTDTEAQMWYSSIARDIAATGASESLILAGNGNAFEVSFAVNLRMPSALIYLTRFLWAGTYDPTRYRTVVKPLDFKGLSTTRTGGSDGEARAEKSLITTPDDVRAFEQRAKRSGATP
jgi:hypothetical protein